MTASNRKPSGKAINVLLVVIFLVGIALLLYPSVSDWINKKHQSKVIATYKEKVEELTEEEKEAILKEAHSYNEALTHRNFSLTLSDEEKKVYESVLNPFGDGMMGYVEIPKINCYLAIYHGTDTSTLSKNIGHLQGTSVPVGGKSTHAVISGHRGLTSARLFTDLDMLIQGDIFMIHVLDETLTYEVDQVLTVLPEEISELVIVEGEDLCTLVTCTPYGVNTHRLLVRGHRIDNIEDIVVSGDAMQISSLLVALLIAIPILLIILIVALVINKRKGLRKVE